MAITAATVVLWLLVVLMGVTDIAPSVMGFIPARLSGTLQIAPAVPPLFTPITATLVHADIFHLLLNMVILLWCGTAVERVLGRGALIFLYVMGAYTAAMAQWAVDPQAVIPMIGASGAIGAIIGAFALSFGRPKQIVRSQRLNRAINALWLLAAWIVLQLMTGLIAGGQGIALATAAHIGGFMAGLLMQRPLLIWRYRKA